MILKKIKKFMLIFFNIFFIIVLLNNSTYALSEEIKERINFKTVEDDGEPEEYDVLVDDAKDLIKSLKLPQITLSLEKVLYGHQDILDIKLLSSETENEDEFWLRIRNVTKAFYRGALYISFAAMISILLYMAVGLVLSTFSSNADNLEVDVSGAKKRSVIKNLKDKLFIQEWIVGIIALALLTVGINFMIYFSDYLIYSSPIGVENMLGKKDGKDDNKEESEGIDEQDITVYVKGGEFPIDKISVVGNISDTTTYSSYMFIGDSRIVQMKNYLGNAIASSDVFIAKGAMGYSWFEKTAWPEAQGKIKKGMNVIVWMGTNDYYATTAKKYASLMNKKVDDWEKKGVAITAATVGPARASKTSLNNRYEQFNSYLKNAISQKIHYSDVYSYLKNAGYVVPAGDTSGVHYDKATYQKVYNYFKGAIGGDITVDSDNVINTGRVIKDFYFDTNTEGLLIFKSQYDWTKKPGTNIFYIFTSAIVTGTKYVILLTFFFRVLILAVVISISPILVLINIYKRINREKGFLTKWIRLFLYLVFLRTIVYMVYYVFLRAKPESMGTSPTYIIIVSITLLILCIASTIWIFKSLFTKTKRYKK